MFRNIPPSDFNPRFDLIQARQLAYLVKGFTSSPDFSEAYNKTTETFGYGEDSLLECLHFPSHLLADIYDSRDDHPGVFEYEVTQHIGIFLAAHLAIYGECEWDTLRVAVNEYAEQFFDQ